MIESQAEGHGIIRRFTARAIRAWDRLVRAGTECHLHACAAGYVLCVQRASDAAACRALALHELSVVTEQGKAGLGAGDSDWWMRSGAFADARDLFAAHPEYERAYNLAYRCDFVEIGVCDAESLLHSYPEDARGLSVDPLQQNLDRLPDRPRVTKVCAAVTGARDGTGTLFFVDPHDIRHNELPQWLIGRSSMDRPDPVVARQLRKLRRGYLYRQMDVRVCSIDSLLDAHGVLEIGFLAVNAGEQGCEIVKRLIHLCVQSESMWPRRIRFGRGAAADPKDVDQVMHILGYEGNYRLVSKRGEIEITMERMQTPTFANVHYGRNGTFAALSEEKCALFVPRAPTRLQIVPFNLFQFWHSAELPGHISRMIERTKEQNPEFSHHLFNLESAKAFIAANFHEDVVRAFTCLIPFAYKCDLFRYCVLFALGGIYLDMKFQCVNGFKLVHMLDGPVVLDYPHHHWFEHDHIGVCNGCLAFPPKSPILKECIDRIVENVKRKHYGFSFLCPTGPGLLGRVFEEMHPDVTPDMCLVLKNSTVFIMRNNCVVIDSNREYVRNDNKSTHYTHFWARREVYSDWDST